jgi:bacterioferritin-associated ferredoxin
VVRECIASGATTREAVTKACEAGGDCGACHQMIEEMVEDHLIDASKLNRTRAA